MRNTCKNGKHRVSCPHHGSQMKGGGCSCNSSSNVNKPFFGGKKHKTIKRLGGSAHLSQLSSSHYYPQNNLMQDPSAPINQISGRFQQFPDFTKERMFTGGKSRKNRRKKRASTKRKSKYHYRKRKITGGMPYTNFLSSFMDTNTNGYVTNTMFGTNTHTVPSHLQSLTVQNTPSEYKGFDTKNNVYLT